MLHHHYQLPHETVDAIMESIRILFPQDYPLFLVLSEVGIRQYEAVALTTRDVHGSTVNVTQLWREESLLQLQNLRIIPVSAPVAHVLTDHIATLLKMHPNRQSPLFLFADRRTGKPISGAYIARVWQTVLAELHLRPISIHALRMSRIMRLVQKRWWRIPHHG